MREKEQPNQQEQDRVILAAARREAKPMATAPAEDERKRRHGWENEEPERWDGMS